LVGLPYLIWLGSGSKELIPANKEKVLEYLITGEILFNDHLYLLSEKIWIPIFKLEEFEKHSFPFHEHTPATPDWHPPPLPKISLVSKAQRDSERVSIEKVEKNDADLSILDLILNKMSLLEDRLISGRDVSSDFDDLSKEFSNLSEKDINKWTILEKRMNWFDEKLSEYTDRRSYWESLDKEKSNLLRTQIKHAESKLKDIEVKYYSLQNHYRDALGKINLKDQEINRLSKIEEDFKKAQEKAHFFLEELSEVKYKMKQRETLHEDTFIKETFEKLFQKVDEKIATKINEASQLHKEASAGVEDFHQAILDLREGQTSKDEKFDSIVDLISKQSKVVSGLLERREALDKRIVEKVEDGVSNLSKDQRELARKIQMVIHDFKNLESTVTLTAGDGSKSNQIEVIKKWQSYSKDLEREVKKLKDKLISEMASTQIAQANGNVSKDHFEKLIIEKEKSDSLVEEQNLIIQTQKAQLQKLASTTGGSDKKYEELAQMSKLQEQKVAKLTAQNTKLKSNLKDIVEKYNVLLRKHKKVDASASEAEEIRLQFEEEQEKTRNMKLDLDNLKAELEKLNDDYEELKSEKQAVEQEQTRAHLVIQELELYKKVAQEQAKKELKRLVGDSFEVSNEETWWLKIGDVVTGTHRFGELYDLKENGELDRDQTMLKNEEEGKWTPMGKFTEFNVPIQTHTIEEDDQKVTKYFIRRGSFRAPFYEIVTLEIGDEEYRGYCTSLSQGGIFIEFNKIDQNTMYKEAMGKIYFKKGALSRGFDCEVKIMNIADKRPRGLGMMFVNLGEADKTLIQNYVNQYMDQSNGKKAA
jgi:chromosome segregation ATPase